MWVVSWSSPWLLLWSALKIQGLPRLKRPRRPLRRSRRPAAPISTAQKVSSMCRLTDANVSQATLLMGAARSRASLSKLIVLTPSAMRIPAAKTYIDDAPFSRTAPAAPATSGIAINRGAGDPDDNLRSRTTCRGDAKSGIVPADSTARANSNPGDGNDKHRFHTMHGCSAS